MAETDEKEELVRIKTLREAATIVSGAREDEYGSPESNLGRIAKLWSVVFGMEVTPAQVAQAMIAVKLARLANNRGEHADSWIDIAGYAAIGSEVAEK